MGIILVTKKVRKPCSKVALSPISIPQVSLPSVLPVVVDVLVVAAPVPVETFIVPGKSNRKYWNMRVMHHNTSSPRAPRGAFHAFDVATQSHRRQDLANASPIWVLQAV